MLGSTPELMPIRNMELTMGKFLPQRDPRRSGTEAVIGSKLKKELFGSRPALGQWIRIHDTRFRVIGVLAPLASDDLAGAPIPLTVAAGCPQGHVVRCEVTVAMPEGDVVLDPFMGSGTTAVAADSAQDGAADASADVKVDGGG